MFLGHFAAGLLAARAEPRLRLGPAFLAAQWADVVWPVFVLAGVERVAIAPGDTAVTPLRFEHYPWSHSLLMDLAWAAVLAALWFRRGRTARGAALVAALVVSHWALDFASHRADMPLWPGSPRFGLGLWQSVPLTLAVEGALFASAVWLYARGRRVPRAFVALVVTLCVVYVANVFGPPPPSVSAVAVSALLLGPLVWWWGNRATVSAPPVR